jgi:hypothetical protein
MSRRNKPEKAKFLKIDPKVSRKSTKKSMTIFNGRDGGIRTHDPLHPMQVR